MRTVFIQTMISSFRPQSW